MADIHSTATRVRRLRERIVDAFAVVVIIVDRYIASISVAVAAVALSVTHIELQYIVGGFIVVYAQTLSRKRFNRDVNVTAPDPAPIRQSFPTGSETEKMFGGKRDSIADALDR